MKTYRIANKICFTQESALEYFRLLATRCQRELTLESSVILTNAADELHRELGLSYQEIEQIEKSCL